MAMSGSGIRPLDKENARCVSDLLVSIVSTLSIMSSMTY